MAPLNLVQFNTHTHTRTHTHAQAKSCAHETSCRTMARLVPPTMTWVPGTRAAREDVEPALKDTISSSAFNGTVTREERVERDERPEPPP